MRMDVTLMPRRNVHSLTVTWSVCSQGIRLSGFLETNTEPGQRTLSAFLKPDAAAPAATPPKRRNWNQTFMPREVRECIDQEMEKYQASHPSKEPQPLDRLQAAPSAPSQEQSQQLQLAEAANSNMVQTSTCDAQQQQPSQCGAMRSQADAQQGGSGPSQHLELSLRDWAPPTASQVLAASQQQLDQEPAVAESRPDWQPEQCVQAGTVSGAVGGSQGGVDPCRDILDTAAPGEDTLPSRYKFLQHQLTIIGCSHWRIHLCKLQCSIISTSYHIGPD